MSSLYENLRQLITVVDELRDVGLQRYISLPRIAAIGTQSSGKSSLIESIVGLDFLPRGGGVVTRRPLELRLVHLNTQEFQEDQAWAIFENAGNKKYTNFDDVRKEIERQTDAVAGTNKGIVNDPIVLTVYATGAPDLTLIDLPGVTRVPLKGSDQVEDIEKITREMTLHYIKDPRTIILCVIPANQDMSVSDALQLARQVDPNGVRSIGVITKIDIMDQGTDAVKMLRGEDIPLRLGYVGVKMRNQQDITNNKAVKVSLKEEREWFDNHRLYNKLPPGLVGTDTLITKLTQILFRHIRRFLPEIKKEINEKRRVVQDRLEELGSGIPVDDHARVQLMWTMVTDYCEMFKNTIRGKYDRKLQRYMANLPAGDAMSGGSHVRQIMNDFLVDYVEIPMAAEMTDDDIDRAIRMHEGDSLPGFPSPDTFEYLALPHLQRIAIPAVECVHNVASALDVLSQRMANAVFRRFPKLAEVSLELTANIIQEQKEKTRIVVEQQVSCATGYLFTNDPSYLTEHGSMEPMYEDKDKPPSPDGKAASNKEDANSYLFNERGGPDKDPSLGERAVQNFKDGSSAAYQKVNSMLGREAKPERKGHRYSGPFVKEIRKRLDSYLAITVRNARDAIPKAIGFYLVRAALDKLQFELLNQLNQKDKISELLGEPPHIMEERKSLSSQLAVLTRAGAVLTRDPTLSAVALEAEEDEEPRKSAPSSQGRNTAAAERSSTSTVERKAKPDPPPAVPVRSTPISTAGTAGSTMAASALSAGVATAAANPALLSAAATAAANNPQAVASAASAVAQTPGAMSALGKMAGGLASGARAGAAASLFSSGAKTSGLWDETKPKAAKDPLNP